MSILIRPASPADAQALLAIYTPYVVQTAITFEYDVPTPAEEPDPYLTRDSIRFHEALGYRMAGKFHQCGYKFGRWYHMVWMEKQIGSHDGAPLPILRQ